jgi:hypothetical protein
MADSIGVEQVASRTLRDNLGRIQRTAEELNQAINDMVSACASSRPANALPSMIRAQTSAASLSAVLDVLSRFVANALQSSARSLVEQEADSPPDAGMLPPYEPAFLSDSEPGGAPEPEQPVFDVASLSSEERELHRRAYRVAKVSMQDIKMLHPEEIKLGRENKDLCSRLRDDIEKAHKEYGRRFESIQAHPMDYFYDWMVEILADGNPEALGEYPYPSPSLRR